MKLLDLNISIKIDNTKQIVDLILNQEPDIITLQEVMRPLGVNVFDQYRSAEGLQLALREKYPYSFFGAAWVTEAMKKNGIMHRDFGGLVEMGNMIFSKFPIIFGESHHFYGHYNYALDWTNFDTEDHPRPVEIVLLNTPSGTLQLLNVHGIWTKDKTGDARTMQECQYVLNLAQQKNFATIIAGDFNLLPTTDSIALLNKAYKNVISEYSIISTRPHFNDGKDVGDLVVDYIFVNEPIKVNDCQVVESDISDHLPLILDFEM